MRLRNASAPPSASSQCICASQGVCAFQCVFTQCVFAMRLRLLSLFFDECVFAMRMRLQVDCHTPPRRRNVYMYVYICTHYSLNKCIYIYVYIYLYYACMYVCLYVHMYVCICLSVKITRPQSPRDFATATPWLKCGSRHALLCRQKGASELQGLLCASVE